MGQVDPLCRTIISQSRKLLRTLRKVLLNVKLALKNRLRSAIAWWLHLTNNIVPLGLPEPSLTIQSEASLMGYGFMINTSRYQGTFDDSMKEYSNNVLKLIAIWMATLMIHQENIVLRIVTGNTTALSAGLHQ